MAFDAKIRLSTDTSRVDAGIASVQKKIAGMSSGLAGAVGGLFAVGTITAAVKNMLDFAGNIQDAADRLGVTVERVQELQAAAKLAGKDIGFIETSFIKLEKAATLAANGNKVALKTFNALGVSDTDVATLNKSDLMNKVLAGATSKGAAGQTLLNSLLGGKTGSGLASMASNILNPQDMGLNPVSQETIDAFDEMGDQIAMFTARLRNEAMPILLKVGTFILDTVNKFKQGFEVVASAIYAFLDKVSTKTIAKGIFAATPIGAVKAATGKLFNEEEKAQLTAGVEAAKEAAADAGQAALDEDAKWQEELAKRRAAREAKRKQREGPANRVNEAIAKEEKLKARTLDSPGRLKYGNLLGINTQLRLEVLANEGNEIAKESLDVQRQMLDALQRENDSNPPQE